MGGYRVNFVPYMCVYIYYRKIFFCYLLVSFFQFLFFLMMRTHILKQAIYFIS